MSCDDWSLKHRLVDIASCFYWEDDIDILREKLIEDMERAWKHIDSQPDKTNREYWFMTEWLASINKRFGVDK